MNDKSADTSADLGKSVRKRFTAVFITVFGLVLLTSVIITFLLPKVYASTARIVVEHGVCQVPYGEVSHAKYDPTTLTRTFGRLQSQEVLIPVIEKLKLNENWEKKFFGDEPMPTAEVLKRLYHCVQLGTIPDTYYITITAYSEDRNEAAAIANAIADSYLDFRLQQERDQAAEAIKILQARFKQGAEEIQREQSELETLSAKLKISTAGTNDQTQLNALFQDKKRHLERLSEMHEVLGAKVNQQIINSHIPNAGMPITITDLAVPSDVPVRPNKIVNISIRAIAGIILGLIAGAVAEKKVRAG